MSFPVIKDVKFTIKVTGEATGEEYAGAFKAKQLLTHEEQLRIDAIKRELLGKVNPERATERALDQAICLANTAVRLTSFPDWWKQQSFGQGLYDDAPLKEVYEQALKVEDDFRKEIAEKAKTARGDLEKAGDEKVAN